MATTAVKSDPLADVLVTRWASAWKKFNQLAAALPDDKLEAELVTGTRTFGGVLRHVGYWNRYVADSLNGRKAHDSANELSSKDFPDKARLLRELEKSSGEIANGMSQKLDAKSLELIAMAFEHLAEHYGQMAVYARLLGITPPASRG